MYNDWRNANTPGSGDFIYGGNGTKILKPELRVVWLIYILQIVLLLYLSYKGEWIFTEKYLKLKKIIVLGGKGANVHKPRTVEMITLL